MIVLARAAYNASDVFVNVMTNYQLSDTSWDLGTRAAFFWVGTCLLSSIWRLPEPKKRTYAELDVLFERRVASRRFRGTKIDLFEREVSGGKGRLWVRNSEITETSRTEHLLPIISTR